MASVRDERFKSSSQAMRSINGDEIQIDVLQNVISSKPTETTPLLHEELSLAELFSEEQQGAQSKIGWLKWASNGIYDFANKTKTGVVETVKHPLSSILGLGTSAQPIISAVANASETDPKDINSKWWPSLSSGTKLQASLTLFFTLWVNFPVNKKFIEDAYSKLKTHSKDMFKSIGNFIDNASSVFLALMSGLAAAAITFEAFLWVTVGGILIPTLFAGLNFLTASTSRYIGIKRVFNLLKTFFSQDAHVQKQSIEALKHLNLDCEVELDQAFQSVQSILENFLQQQINETLRSKCDLNEKDVADLEIMREKERERIAKSKSITADELENTDKLEVERIVNQQIAEIKQARCKLTDDDYELLFKTLVAKLAELEALHPENLNTHLFTEKQTYEYIAEYSNLLVKFAFALVFGFSAGGVYLQKGFDGINILSKFATDNDLSHLPTWTKRFLGSPSSLASLLLYAASAADFPDLFFVKLPSYLYDHPKQICSAILLLVANYYASGSMQSVTTSVVNRDDNLLGLLSAQQMKEILPYVVRTGCGFVNIISQLRKYSPSPAESNRPTVSDLIHHFEDPTNHCIQHDTALACSIANNKLSFFKKPAQQAPSFIDKDLHPNSTKILPT